MKPVLAIIVLLMLFTSHTTSPVYACSGGGTETIRDLLNRTDYVVKARPVSVDDSGQNGVLQVERYLAGGEYVVLVQNEPTVVVQNLEGYNNNCNYLDDPLKTGEESYYFIKRRPDGAYAPVALWGDPNRFTFPDASATVTFYTREGKVYTEHVLNEVQFNEFIAEQSGDSSTSPDHTSPYPRLAPLKITTEDTDYLLPLDTDQPVTITPELIDEMSTWTLGSEMPKWNERSFNKSQCPSSTCVQVAPNGLDKAWQDGFTVRWFSGSANGNAFLFSATSDAIAVWLDTNITIHTRLHNEPPRRIEVNQPSYEAAWSPDGRIFAYSDSKGLWTLDVYTSSSEPTLRLPAENGVIPTARYYSPQGRYLALKQGERRFTLDTVSGQEYPDGLVSPDERLLLAFDTTAAVSGKSQICSLISIQPCGVGPSEPQICSLISVEPCASLWATAITTEGSGAYFDQFKQIEWRDAYSFQVTVCKSDDLEDCVVDRHFNEQGYVWRHSVDYHRGHHFDYQMQHGTLAVVQDASTIVVDDIVIDLATLPPITSVEWLDSVFYRRE